jgi:quinate dehydrogenase
MPNKINILKYLDALEPAAKDVGACNTIFTRIDSRTKAKLLIGTNTDIVGIRQAFYQNVMNASVFHDRPAVVIGGGGAARSAVYALRKSMRASKIYIVNRDDAEAIDLIADCQRNGYGEDVFHVKTAAQAQSLEDPGAIVSCVPDFEPSTKEEEAAREVLVNFLNRSYKGAVLEMCYHPRTWTSIAEISQKAGWQVILGSEAMIYQGLEQDRYWTGREIKDLPINTVKKVIASQLSAPKSRF